jgi:RNA 2',3'-cyclic 3'-phosphodiesterase
MAIVQLKVSKESAGGLARIFLAICPPQPIRTALTRYQNTCAWNRGVALVSPTKFHITLYFIGEVERQRLAEIRQALKIPFTPFDLKLDRAELWAAGIAVLRPSELPGEFLTLQDSLSKRAHELGLSVEKRDLKLHLTLARDACGATWPKQKPEMVWPVDHYALLESRLNAPAPYKELQKYSHTG